MTQIPLATIATAVGNPSRGPASSTPHTATSLSPLSYPGLVLILGLLQLGLEIRLMLETRLEPGLEWGLGLTGSVKTVPKDGVHFMRMSVLLQQIILLYLFLLNLRLRLLRYLDLCLRPPLYVQMAEARSGKSTKTAAPCLVSLSEVRFYIHVQSCLVSDVSLLFFLWHVVFSTPQQRVVSRRLAALHHPSGQNIYPCPRSRSNDSNRNMRIICTNSSNR